MFTIPLTNLVLINQSRMPESVFFLVTLFELFLYTSEKGKLKRGNIQVEND